MNHLRIGLVLAFIFSIVISTFSGCTHQSASRNNIDANADAGPAIPADSPFARIEVGMSMNEVTNILGSPTDTVSYMTGKSFIPFYFGKDHSRIELRYKGLGRITMRKAGSIFSPVSASEFQGTVTQIVYDPNESGHFRR